MILCSKLITNVLFLSHGCSARRELNVIIGVSVRTDKPFASEAYTKINVKKTVQFNLGCYGQSSLENSKCQGC
jgi:hypothetical protein